MFLLFAPPPVRAKGNNVPSKSASKINHKMTVPPFTVSSHTLSAHSLSTHTVSTVSTHHFRSLRKDHIGTNGKSNVLTVPKPHSSHSTHSGSHSVTHSVAHSVTHSVAHSVVSSSSKYHLPKDRDSNIRQKVHVVPPKTLKKKASIEELQLVINHFAAAEEKDIEGILKQHEPHVLEYRDKIYAQALNDGVTVTSDDMTRLKVLAPVVEYAFMNIEPPNEYTKLTDRRHFKEVAAWACKFAKDKDIVPPLTLVYTAWCHDIERFIPSTKCEYLPEAVDKYRKQAIHSMTSSNVAMCLLKGAPVTEQEKQRIFQLILHHDMPHPS